tara:strand:+ start:387 stop:545 length:159 start_codon:yes stop_codon:yes gene_type:complete
VEICSIYLLALLAAVMIFSTKTLKRLSGYQDIVENLPDPVMRVADNTYHTIF